jgi:tagaturonate epimerase
VEAGGVTYFLARGDEGRVLVIEGDAAGFEGQLAGDRLVAPLTASNAAALRARLPWLRPQPLGLALSAGCGDRLGLATPGHIRALRQVETVAPILAQQSIRENARTGRTPQQVLDDAMWGVFQEGWRAPWGADADHLKTTADIDTCVAAGYSFYTVDPGDHVDNEAHTASLQVLRGKLHDLPWAALDDGPEALHQRYLGRDFEVEGHVFAFDETSLARAAAKYGRALAHASRMFRHLAAAVGDQPFEFEVSVDETATPTSPLEHYFVASELRRLGVRWVSLAPRYVGRFEKGVDYIGDLAEFDAELSQHAAIARALGPYKLSIHSGSDKFSVYPLFARHAGELVHLKTAGTSYLEALRAIARVDPGFFREILALARACYEEDRATYHVSAELDKVPPPDELQDEELAGVLSQFDGREVLHVTFGSVLDRFGDRLLGALDAHEEAYYAVLDTHFQRHLAPFAC